MEKRCLCLLFGHAEHLPADLAGPFVKDAEEQYPRSGFRNLSRYTIRRTSLAVLLSPLFVLHYFRCPHILLRSSQLFFAADAWTGHVAHPDLLAAKREEPGRSQATRTGRWPRGMDRNLFLGCQSNTTCLPTSISCSSRTKSSKMQCRQLPVMFSRSP